MGGSDINVTHSRKSGLSNSRQHISNYTLVACYGSSYSSGKPATSGSRDIGPAVNVTDYRTVPISMLIVLRRPRHVLELK